MMYIITSASVHLISFLETSPLFSSLFLSLGQLSPTFLAPGASFVEDNFSTDLGGRWGMVQEVMAAMGRADEASLAGPPLTSCCAARYLTGRGPAPVHCLGVGDSCSRPGKCKFLCDLRFTEFLKSS